MRPQSAAYLASAMVFGARLAAAQADDTPFTVPMSEKDMAKVAAEHIMTIYLNDPEAPEGSAGPLIPGLFPSDYYFWESGLAWDALVNYWAYTGDDAAVEQIQQALTFQVGPNDDYMPPNQTKSLGNDDQTSWALAAMSAAELGFPVPTDFNLTWHDLAKNVFDEQVARWDEATCAGGLRWQIFTFNNGYNYKNALTQANFAQLGARLYRFTGNSTYLDWAERAVDWATKTGLITSGRDTTPAIYDGTDVTVDCSEVNHIQWTINAGQFMNAFAYACNGTCSDTWKELGRVALATTTATFAKNSSILTEVACAGVGTCNTDQRAFRAPLARALANARDMASAFDDQSKQDAGKIVTASYAGAKTQCSVPNKGCGSDWTASAWDGTSGLGEDLSALEMMLATFPRKLLLTINSTGNGDAGGQSGGTTGNSTAGNGTTGGSGSSGEQNAAAGGVTSSIMSVVMAGFAIALLMSL